MFESFARVFLTQLILKYGLQEEEYDFSKSFTAQHYRQILDYIATNYGNNILLILMFYRVEQAKKMLDKPNTLTIDIAFNCGFSDQAHFSRVFKKVEGMTPKQYRNKIKR